MLGAMSTMHVAVALGFVAISCITNIYSGGVTFNRYKKCDVYIANGPQTNCEVNVIDAENAYVCASQCEKNETCNYVAYNNDCAKCHLFMRDPEPEEGDNWHCQQVVDCGPPPSRQNTVRAVSNTFYGGEATYRCDNGYTPRHTVTITCQADGTWEDLTLKCEPVDCGEPPDKDVHEVTFLTTTYPSPALYTCAHGYKTLNRGRSKCGSNAKWYRPCLAIDCGSPPGADKHKIYYKETTFQSEATYTCGEGYTTLNDGVSVCQENEEWTKVCQEVDCGPPPSSYKHTVHYYRTTYLAEAVYSCALGYYIEGPSVCQADGSWSLECKEIPDLRGIHYLPNLMGEPSCRNVQSYKHGKWRHAICDDDEILTGCSIKSSTTLYRHGSYVWKHNYCTTETGYGEKTIARCCKISDLQCEYIKSVRESISCYKDFQLLDCACWPEEGDCHSSMDSHTCYSTDTSRKAYRYAVCCSTGTSCYVKSAKGDSNTDHYQLKITCNNNFELMTGCSGFNTGYNIKKAEIKKYYGVDTCVIEPRYGSMSTLTGYVSCCDL